MHPQVAFTLQLPPPRKIHKVAGKKICDVEQRFLLLRAFIMCIATYTMMTTQMLPTYLAWLGGSLTFAGKVLSLTKVAGLASTILSAWGMQRYGILRVLYFQLSFGGIGALLFIASYFWRSSPMTLLAMILLGVLNGTSLSVMTFIKLNFVGNKQPHAFLRIEISVLAGLLLAPAVMTFCMNRTSQVLAPFGVAAMSTSVLFGTLAYRYGLDNAKFSESIVTRGVNMGHNAMFSWMGSFYVVGSFLPLLSSATFTTLSSVACFRSYGWSANDMWYFTLPYQVVGIACLLTLPRLMQCVHIQVLLLAGSSAAVLSLFFLIPFNNSVPAFRFVFGWSLGGNFADKLLSVVPMTVLSCTVSPREFTSFLARAQVLDSALNIILPILLLSMYSQYGMPAAFVAAMYILPYLFLTVTYAALFQMLPALEKIYD